MKQIFRSIALISFAMIVVAALSLQAFAHGAHDKKIVYKKVAKTVKSEFLGKGDGLKTCPVTGEDIHSKDIKGRFFNRTVYFCCAACLAEAKKSPVSYLKRTQAAQIAATKNLPKSEGHHGDHQAQNSKEGDKGESKDGEKKFLGKGDGIETCPVMGSPVNKDIKHEVNGRVFYVCCPGCAELVKENPDQYLKPAQGEKKEQKFLGKGDGIETCPVMGSPVNKNIKHEVNGRVFYVCCPGCAELVKENPDQYLKPVEGEKKTGAK